MCYLRRLSLKVSRVATLTNSAKFCDEIKKLTCGIRSPLKRIPQLWPLIRRAVHQVVGHGFFIGLIISSFRLFTPGSKYAAAAAASRDDRTHARTQADTHAGTYTRVHTRAKRCTTPLEDCCCCCYYC